MGARERTGTSECQVSEAPGQFSSELSERDWTENRDLGEARQPSPAGVAALVCPSGGNGPALANRPGTGLPSVLASRSVAGASAVADTPVRTADRSSR